jgi:hypothetical protein
MRLVSLKTRGICSVLSVSSSEAGGESITSPQSQKTTFVSPPETIFRELFDSDGIVFSRLW